MVWILPGLMGSRSDTPAMPARGQAGGDLARDTLPQECQPTAKTGPAATDRQGTGLLAGAGAPVPAARGWQPYGRSCRSSVLDGHREWLKERFLAHRGKADVVRQELRNAALTTVRLETSPGRQVQGDVGQCVVRIGGERARGPSGRSALPRGALPRGGGRRSEHERLRERLVPCPAHALRSAVAPCIHGDLGGFKGVFARLGVG